MSEFVCGYCDADWAPVRETIACAVEAPDGEEYDQLFEGDMCPTCSEFNGRSQRETGE